MSWRGDAGRPAGPQPNRSPQQVATSDGPSDAESDPDAEPGMTPELGMTPDDVLQASLDSFPASDAPAWTCRRAESAGLDLGLAARSALVSVC